MKKLLIFPLLTLSLFATDYSSMSLEELLSNKGTIPAEDKTAFQDAMKSKVQALTPEERASMNLGKDNTNGKGTMQRLRDGSGTGNMYKGSRSGGKH